jgi:hypothetical protein
VNDLVNAPSCSPGAAQAPLEVLLDLDEQLRYAPSVLLLDGLALHHLNEATDNVPVFRQALEKGMVLDHRDHAGVGRLELLLTSEAKGNKLLAHWRYTLRHNESVRLLCDEFNRRVKGLTATTVQAAPSDEDGQMQDASFQDEEMEGAATVVPRVFPDVVGHRIYAGATVFNDAFDGRGTDPLPKRPTVELGKSAVVS